MIYLENTEITNLAIHFVGNKSEDDFFNPSKSEIRVEENIKQLLLNYFVPPFKSEEYFHFYHDIDINMNEVYICISKIFEDNGALYEQSVNLAKHLFEQSIHPKIKEGEFYTVYFKNLVLDGEAFDAVGLFKSENKDTFLKVDRFHDNFELDSEKGININKLDKGCIIFNKEQENGYVVAVVDHTNRGAEAQYWMDDFLHVRQIKDKYYNTHNLLTFTKDFITKELPQQFEITKADQVDLLNKSVKYFKENDEFGLTEFANEIMAQPEVINCFNEYKSVFEKERNLEIADEFDISGSAVKKQARIFKSVIKLDKNFHIYVHGNRDLIEQGIDEKGRRYYKIYYTEEN
ncbi:MAG: nucleoid-associated protein [Bacteroidales bacterium]|jgi:hypothetical protein|nr:nucleoid-associated protein [Bacteroidales bacterium]